MHIEEHAERVTVGCDFFNLRFDQAAPDVRGEEHVFLRAPVIMEAYGFCEVDVYKRQV